MSSLDDPELVKRAQGSLQISAEAFSVGPTVAPIWIDTDLCMICDKQFNTFTRRHHCRVCGYCTCSSCCSTYITLTQSSKRVRVCDKCVSDQHMSQSDASTPDQLDFSSKRPIGTEINMSEPHKGLPASHHHSVALQSPQTSQLLGIMDVPAWTYIMKPFSSYGDQVRIGRVALRIVEAKNLPFPSTKPYKSLSLVPSVTVGDQKLETAPVDLGSCGMRSTLSTVVDTDLLLDVSSSQQEIRVQFALLVSDPPAGKKKTKSSDSSAASPSPATPIGFASINVQSLHDSGKASADRLMLTLALQGTYHRDSALDDDRSSQPQVTVEVQYLSNPVGHFWSQFTVPDADSVCGTAYHRPVLFTSLARDFLHLLFLASPLTALLDVVHPVVSWVSPATSFAAILGLLFCIFFAPSLILINILLLALRFAYRTFKAPRAHHFTAPSGLSLAQVDGLAALLPDPLAAPAALANATDVGGSVSPVQASTDLLLVDLFQELTEQLLPLAGLGSLMSADHAVSKALGTVRQTYSLLDWSSARITGIIVGICLLGLVQCVWGEQSTVWIVSGVVFLGWNSMPAHIVRVIFGMIQRSISKA